MRSCESHDRPQTLKQAKKAFKARGPTSVSVEQRRKLERGAELIERASRCKQQEERKALLESKREEKESTKKQQQQQVHLGTQRKLDKFGYKSSQLHLGAFWKPPQPSINASAGEEKASSQPWDDDLLDDDTLLDIVNESPDWNCVDLRQGNITAAAVLPTRLSCPALPSSNVDGDPDPWSDCDDSNTQLACELSNECSGTRDQPPASSISFGSFGSSDFDLTSDDLDALDASVSRNVFTALNQRRPQDMSASKTPVTPQKHFVFSYAYGKDDGSVFSPPKFVNEETKLLSPSVQKRARRAGLTGNARPSEQVRSHSEDRKLMSPPPTLISHRRNEIDTPCPKQKPALVRTSELHRYKASVPTLASLEVAHDISIAELEYFAQVEINLTQDAG
ncbi:hypothetical protein AAFC00_006131 [Neodothiora populina]|uniref:Uncharacterized protein n=1 Tax=Neodothiora populina TaxID=2781224 RepID=A0ABR3P5H7_9PEZI